MNINKKEDQLFAEWSTVREELSQDGIVDEKHYLDSSLKILFVLKEVNAKGGFDLRQFLREGGRGYTWNNVARWTHGIRNIHRNIEPQELEQIKTTGQRKEILKSICAINLKKSPGGGNTINTDLQKIATEDNEFLNRQFQIYFESAEICPNFIISCGVTTSRIFNSLVEIKNKSEWKKTRNGVWYYEFENKRFFIQYSHPQARKNISPLAYGLLDAIKEIMQKE